MRSNKINNITFWLSLLVLALLLTACGSQPAVEEAPAEEVPAETAEESAEVEEEAEVAEMRTITDAMGREVSMPVEPRRIVVMSEIDLDSLLALGIVPVGAPNGRGQQTLPTYMLPIIEGQTTSIGGLSEPNLETVLNLEPDLIVYSDPWGDLAERIPDMEEIAPVVVPYVDEGDWHWKSVFTAIADVMDKSAEAEAWFEAYDAQTAALGGQLSDEVREVSIVRWMGDGPRILLSNAFSSDVLSDVGFTRPDYQLELAGSHPVHTDAINMEQIDVVDADIVFAGGLNPDGDTAMQEALENPLVQEFSSVQNGRLFTVDGLAWSSTGGPTAALVVLGDVENALNKAGTMDEAMAMDGEMRTITDAAGNEVEIPAKPQRIVTLTEMDLDSALAVGITPVGSVNGRGQQTLPSYLLDQTDGVESIGSIAEPNPEVIASLDPDLIIVGSPIPPVQALLPALSEIAPVAVTFAGPGTPWQDALTGVADVLNRTDEADAFIADYEGRVADISGSLPADLAEASIIRWNPDGPVVMLPNAFSSGVIADVGIARPQAQADLEGAHPVHSDVISMEQIQVIDSDVIFAGGLNPDGDAAFEAALDDPLMQALGAVQDNHLVQVDGLVWGSVGGPIAAMTVLDDVETAIGTFEAMAMDGDAGFPLTLEHKYGSTTIDEQPLRVVSVGYSEHDELLALGVTPLGVRQWYGDYPYEVWPWAQDELGDAQPETIATDVINFEAIAALEPDLIVGVTSGMTEEEYEFLSEIAPTLPQSGDYVDYGVPWQEVTRVLGQAVGRSEQAEKIVTDLEDRFVEIRETYPEFNAASLAVAFWWNETPGVYASQDARPRLLGDLGFVTPEMYDELAGDSFFLSFSEEELPEMLDVNLVVWLAATDEEIQGICDQPLRATLTTAQEGREVYLGKLLGGAFSFSSPLSLNYLLDEIVPMLEAAIDGDPDTVVPESAGDESAISGSIEIEHELGTTVLDGIPERIVVLEYSFADNLGTLGVAPVGYAVDAPPDYVLTLTEDLGAEAVGTRKEPNLEAIVGLNPDFIIADLRRHEAIYDQLSAIAPTVIFNSLRGSYQDQLDTFGKIAQALGKEDEAATLLDEYQTRFETVAAETSSDAGDFVIGVLWADGYTAHSNESFMGSFLEDLGRTNALTPREGETQYLLDIEGLASVNPSSIVIMCAPGDQAVLDEWEAQPVWQAFDAVQNDRVYFFDRNLWSKGRGLIAFDTILDDAIDSGLLSDSASSTATGCP
ncbi:MAG: ABC transporter substrate-binding protein [Chloroflexota bacterium]